MGGIVFLMLSLVAVTASPSKSDRIIGGIQTSVNQYPYMTALLNAIDSSIYVHFCGGTIINARSILSAAHCVHNFAPERLRLRVGSSNSQSGGVIYSAEFIFNHASFNRPIRDNDISIIRTTASIVYNNVIKPADLAGHNYIVPDNAVVWPVGWGRTSIQGPLSQELLHTQVWTINQELCAQRYGELINYHITANMLCSGWVDMGGRGQCNGDSGGPVVHNGVVVGITSWVYECAGGRFPTVNVRVSQYTSWIQAHATENLRDLKI